MIVCRPRQRRLWKMDELHPKYIAGLIDGEGWFSIKRSRLQPRSLREFSFQVCVQMALRERFMLEQLQRQYGGSISNYKSRSDAHAPYYCWTLVGEGMVNFLRDVMPHLRLKEAQAKVAFDFQTTKQKRFGRGMPMTDREYEKRTAAFETMRELNKRGVPKLERTT